MLAFVALHDELIKRTSAIILAIKVDVRNYDKNAMKLAVIHASAACIF